MNGRADLAYYSFEFDRGYRTITKYKDANLQNQDGDAVIEKMSKDDKYFIVVVDYQGNANGVVYVRNGIIPNGWEVKGSAVVKANSGAYVIYAVPADITGFKNTAHEIGFVLYEKSNGAALSAAYDEAIGGDWYLLGSTQTEVVTFDILTGNRETCFVSNNIDLQKGRIYVTMNFGGARMIISSLPDNVGCTGDGETIFTRIQQLYNEKDVDLARFVVTDKTFTFTKDTFSKLELAKALKISGTNIGDKISEKIADETIKGLSFYVISDNAGHYIEEVRDIKAGENYKGIAIYDCETQKAVIYILEADATTSSTVTAEGKGITIDSWKYTNIDQDKVIESALKVDFDYSYTSTKDANGNETKSNFKLGKVKLYFDTLAEKHGDIAFGGYLFGLDRVHDSSIFSFNDSLVRVHNMATGVPVTYPYVNNGKFTLDSVKCDACDIVTATEIDLSDVEFTSTHSVFVRIEINGKNVENGLATGNDVAVTLAFVVNNDKVEVSVVDYEINGSTATTTDGHIGHIDQSVLSNVDLTALYNYFGK